jgi:hypothetical protein
MAARPLGPLFLGWFGPVTHDEQWCSRDDRRPAMTGLELIVILILLNRLLG